MAVIMELKIQDGNVVGKVKDLEKQVNKVDKAGKKAAGAGGGLGQLEKGLKRLVGAYVGIRALQEFIKVGVQFETSMLRVKAVSKATETEFARLQKTAQHLGKTTTFTASQVADLEHELAKLGFTAGEITDAAGGVLLMAQATGTDLARAAEVAGSTLRAFNFEALQSNRVADVMAKSFTSSALDMEKFAESVKYAAPISASLNVTLEETTAMLGILADRGLHGSLAGTSLRNMMIKLAAPTSEASKKLEGLSIATNSMAEIFQYMQDKGYGAAQMEVLFGKRSLAAATVLTTVGGPALEEFTAELENAHGAAKEMADTMMGGWHGSIKLAQSAFQGLVLTLFDVTSSGSSVIDVFTEFITMVDSGTQTLLDWGAGLYDLFDQMGRRGPGAAGELSWFSAAGQREFNDNLEAGIKNTERMTSVFKKQKEAAEELAQVLKIDLKNLGVENWGEALTKLRQMASSRGIDVKKAVITKRAKDMLDKANITVGGAEDSNRISREDFNQKLAKLDARGLRSQKEDPMLAEFAADAKFAEEALEGLLQAEEKFLNKMDLMEGITRDFGFALGAAFTGDLNNMKNFLKDMLMLILNFLQMLSLEALAAAGFKSIFGDWGAMIKYLAVAASFEVAKGAIASFKSGGVVSDLFNGKLSKGGMISGPGHGTSDSILARVSTGEAILNARAVRNLGTDRINFMNENGALPGFARGGIPGARTENYVGNVTYNFANSSQDPYSVFRNHRNFIRSRRGKGSLRSER